MKKMAKLVMLAFAMIVSCVLSAGMTTEAAGTANQAGAQKVTAVSAYVRKAMSYYDTTFYVNTGTRYQVVAKVAPANATTKTVKYSSNNPRVARVDERGVLTVLREGKATVYVQATDGSRKYTALNIVSVNASRIKTKVTTIKATGSRTNLVLGGALAQAKIRVGVAPSSASMKRVAYISSNPGVVKVDATTGVVTAVKPGRANVYVKTLDGSNKYARVTFTVYDSVKSIRFTKSNYKVYVGQYSNVLANLNKYAYGEVTYSISSADQKIAKVGTYSGKILGVARGTVTVTARATGGKTTTAKITVVDKTVTKVTPVKGSTADATVTFTGSMANIEKDILSLLKKSGLDANTTKQIKVNGNTHTVKYTGSTLVFDGNKKLTDVTKGTKTVEVGITADAIKFVKGLEMASFKSGTYNYTIKIGGYTFKKLVLGNPYMKLSTSNKTYSVYAQNGSLYFVGTISNKLKNAIEADGAAKVTVVKQ